MVQHLLPVLRAAFGVNVPWSGWLVSAYALGYAITGFITQLGPAVLLLCGIMTAGGFLFPVLMGILQSKAAGARGTVSSLANVAMYGGTTVGVAIAGPLFAATSGFSGVASLAVVMYLVSLLLFVLALRTA